MDKVLLFDIDGTLVLTGGAGVQAMFRAFAEIFGVADGLDGVEMAGRSDTAILRNALDKNAISTADFPDQVRRFRAAYRRHLADTLQEVTGGHVLPGVRDLLNALQSLPGVRLGLATGNFREGAELKLSHYGLWHFFSGGAFGEDSEERAPLVAAAIKRMGDDRDDQNSATFYVIGDTVYDVEAAKANGAVAVAVTTGRTPADRLRAAGADLLFPDLSDWRAVLAALGLGIVS
jgi:phosphoglycolate phosphatase-like HAD superfamily hydrolase